MPKGDSMDRQFWDGSLCLLENTKRRAHVRCHMAMFEEFSKPQTNEVRACFDLLTTFGQGSRNVDEWYNAVQAQVNLAKYPLETAKILHRDTFWFFMKDEDFVTKTIMKAT